MKGILKVATLENFFEDNDGNDDENDDDDEDDDGDVKRISVAESFWKKVDRIDAIDFVQDWSKPELFSGV